MSGDVGFEVDDLANLHAMQEHMHHVNGQIWQLSRYVREQVANKEGFTGLLTPFADAMDLIAEAASTTAVRYSNAYSEVIWAVGAAGSELDRVDGEVAHSWSTMPIAPSDIPPGR